MTRRNVRCSYALMERLIDRMAGGETIASLAADPALPALATLYRWLKTHPELRERLGEARARRTWMMRRRWPRKGGRFEPAPLYSEALAQSICEGVLDGLTVHEVLAAPGMPHVATLYNWLNRHPAFARMFAIACHLRNQALADEVLAIAETCLETPDEPGRPPLTVRDRIDRAKLQIDGRKWRLASLTPKRYRLEWMEG